MFFKYEKPDKCSECLFCSNGLDCRLPVCVFNFPDDFKENNDTGLKVIDVRTIVKDTSVSRDELEIMENDKTELESFFDWLKRDIGSDLGKFLVEQNLIKFIYSGMDQHYWSEKFQAIVHVLNPEDIE